MQIPGFDPKISITVPCFNEADNSEILAARVAELRAHYPFEFEIMFIDGGSNDGTPERLETAISENNLESCASVHRMSKRRGYGSDIMYGLKHSKADVLAWTHADMQTDIKDVFTAYERFTDLDGMANHIFMKGKRIKRPFLDAIFTYGMQIFVFFALKINIEDINAQPKLFSRTFYEKYLIHNAPSDFSLDLFAMHQAKKNNFTIETIPVVYKRRLFGQAKGGGGGIKLKLALIRRTASYVIALRRLIK